MPEFLDKVKQGISKGVTTAGIKSKEFIDVTKLKNQISTLENKRQDLIEDLGDNVYAMFLEENIDANVIREKGPRIKNIDDQIYALQREIVAVQKKARELLSEKASPERMPVADESGKAAEAGRFCKQCGEELEAGAKFCANCGTRHDDK